jgi:myo-inositol-1(or 4)-monophosphatase
VTLANDLLLVARDLARSAGDMALAGRKAGLQNVQTKSTATDMVTEFDRASEKLIVEGLRERRPLDAIVGEEGASVAGTSGITWYIDPIDGTTNFLYDLPAWAVSIGAEDSNGPIAGVVYIPALGEMFSATRGGGAFINDSPIRSNNITDVAQRSRATHYAGTTSFQVHPPDSRYSSRRCCRN